MDRSEIALWTIILALCLSNVATLWWHFKSQKQITTDPRIRKIKALVSEFETHGYALVEFRRINPDDVFLRNPEGH